MISSRDFTKLCQERGFSKKGKVYMRCIGDGVLQLITTADTAYTVSVEKSNYIGINLWSMYADLEDYCFQYDKYFGAYIPENIIGQKKFSSFQGIQSEYQIMIETGFDFLDSITTQQKLIDSVLYLQTMQSGKPPHLDTKLCAPFLICGNYAEALSRLCGLYTQNVSAFLEKSRNLRCVEHAEQYIQKELAYENKIKHRFDLLSPVLGNNKDKIKYLLKSYFERNFSLAKENGIPFSENFCPLDLDQIF